MIVFTRITVPGLKAFACTGVAGDEYEMTIPNGFTRATSPYLTLYAEGAASQKCANYPEPKIQGAGRTNVIAASFPKDPGHVIRTVVTPTYRYYCMHDALHRPLEAAEVRLNLGEKFVVEPGHLLFVGTGSVAAQGFVKAAPAVIDCVVNKCEVVATSEGVLAMYIKKLEVAL